MHIPHSQLYLVHDYETRSRGDLKKLGGIEYAKHVSTRVLCVGWRLGTRENLRSKTTKLWSPFLDPKPPMEFIAAMLNPAVIKVAHNALFEQAITKFVLSKLTGLSALRDIPSDQWICTAALAAAISLPRKLEDACIAMALPFQKDMEGHKLMKKITKPRRPSKNDTRKWWDDAADLRRVMQYCGTDVDAETELLLELPPLSPFERRVWLLDQKINLRGFKVDRPLVETILKMIKVELNRYDEETKQLTGGALESTNKLKAFKKYLATKGCHLPNMQAKTIEDALKAGIVNKHCARLLVIRQAVSRTSNAKFSQYELRSRSDSWLRDILMYWGATTGRWAGKGVQPHNFPRGKTKDVILLCEVLAMGRLELIELLYGDPLAAFSDALRAMIIPDKGNRFLCGDYSSIEVRVLFWLAGHEKGLQAYRNDDDLYVAMASVIYGVAIKDVTPTQREVGKRAILGCGYGMGWKKFQETCIKFGQDVDAPLAKKAVKAYRRAHSPVPRLWQKMEKAAMEAVWHPGKVFTINNISWWVEDKILWCKLPSGRKLAYHNPSIKMGKTSWGEKKLTLYHWGCHKKTKKWVKHKTWGGTLVENIIQAIARDLMAAAMLRLDANGYDVRLTVHDEVLTERAIGSGSLPEFKAYMEKLTKWAKGCPVKVTAFESTRYRK